MQTKLKIQATFNTSSQLWEIKFTGKFKDLINFQKDLHKDKFLLSPFLNDLDKRLLASSIFYPNNFYLAIFTDKETLLPNQKKLLEEIIDFGFEIPKVYLIGKSWLKLDIDNMTKTSNDIDFIFFGQKVLKALPTQKVFKQKLNDQILPTGSLLWILAV